MDPNDRDESKHRRREETLARRVGEALDQLNPKDTGECLDAELIAAYSGHGLASDETARCESHFATCARCRNILRVLAASADTPLAESEVARLGELVAAASAPAQAAPKPAKSAHPRAWDWRVRWLAPALGVAAVLAVWFAMRPPWRNTEQGASTTLVAQAPKVPTPSISGPTDRLPTALPPEDRQALKSRSSQPIAQSPALDSRSKDTAGSAAAVRDELQSTTGNQIAPYSALQKKEESDKSASEREARLQASLPPPPPAAPAPAPPPVAAGAPIVSPQSDAKSPADLSSQGPAAIPAPPPPLPTRPPMGALARSAQLPETRSKADKVSPAAPEPPQQTTQSVTVPEAAPMVETTNGTVGGIVQPGAAADLPMNGRNYESLAQRIVPLLKAPSGSVLWRAASGGKIERSNDSGRTWEAQVSPSQEDWLSGAAVSDTVCWLAGRNGAIARTLDGERWDRISPPAQAAGNAAKLPDWTGIVARDAQSATVTASDGRRFATSDGGRTWDALP